MLTTPPPPGLGENPPGAVLPMAGLVESVFRDFTSAGLRWAVLRNAAGLPGHTRYDIDLLVEAASLAKAEDILSRHARRLGWREPGILRKHGYVCRLLVSPPPEGRPGWEAQFLPVDFFSRLDYRGAPMVDVAAAWTGIRETNGVAETAPGFSAATALIKELLPHGTLKENSREAVQSEATADGPSWLAALVPIYGEDLANRLLEATRRGDWPKVDQMAGEIRRQQARGRSPALRTRFLLANLRHHFRPTVSAFVVLIGPDGSGKTTIAEEVFRRLYKRPFKACRYFRGSFAVLPQLKQFKVWAGRLIGRKVVLAPPAEPGTRLSGMERQNSALRSMVYISWYAFDLWIGRLKLRRMRAQWNLILFDRYFHDYHYQYGNRNAPRRFLRLMERFAPKPDLVVFLDRDPDTIFAQKPELSLPEIKRQQACIRELLTKIPNAVRIDANHGVAATADAVGEAVLRAALAGEPIRQNNR